jgi:threonine dehydratase
VTGPTLHEILRARRVLADFMVPTPLCPAPGLGERYGAEVHTKHEHLTPVRSFKVRGALYRLSLFSDAERERGIVTASTGNHGMALAYAARAFATSAVIVVPENTPPIKVRRAAALGAETRTAGAVLSDAIAVARRVASQEGRVFIEDGDDHALMAGAGTIALEVLSELPDADVLLVPVGGGNLIAGVAACAKQLSSKIRVCGVQSEAAPAVYESWRTGRIEHRRAATFAGGLAGDYPGELAFAVLRRWIDEIVLVSEEDLRKAMTTALEDVGQALEGAGAASLAALERYAPRWRGETVVAILTGANVSAREFREAMEARERPLAT